MNHNQPKRCAIYVRVSSEMQIDNYSLDAQENACQSFAELRGWQVVSVFREEGASAKSIERPVFQQMIQSAEQNIFDVILVHKLDRFSRKLKDMIGIIDLFDDIDIALVSVTEQFDLSTPQGKMMVNVMGSVNQWYVDNLAQEISKGKRQRAKSGDWNGRLSYGYTTPSRLEAELSELSVQLRRKEISQEQFREKVSLLESMLDACADAHDTQAITHNVDSLAVIMAFEQYSTGQYSFRQIADLLNEAGYRCISRDGTGLFSKTMISEMLRNRFYVGETSYGSKVRGKQRQWMQGNHEAIISQELFDKCQAIRKNFSNKHKAGSKARPYPLTPMLHELSTGVRWRGRFRAKGREYVREKYQDIPGTHIKADYLENEVIKYLEEIVIPDDWHNRIMNNMAKNNDVKLDNQNAMKQKLERLKTLFLLGDIAEEEYMIERDKINQFLKPMKPKVLDFDALSHVANLMKNIKAIWQVATLPERDRLAKMLFRKIYVNEKSVIAIEPSAILWQLIQTQSLTSLRGGQDSNLRYVAVQPLSRRSQSSTLAPPHIELLN
ncbi:MAG: hypothetical protein Phog2KO_05330 [Phototrophicaceae bacterium]